MTDYDPHLRRLMRSLVQRAKAEDASVVAWMRQEVDRGLEAVEEAAAPLWHGHLHRPAASVTLPAHHSLWLARLEVTSGIVVTVASGAVLKLG
jgi:hypothetical protein